MTVTTDPPEDSYQIRPGALRMPNVEAFHCRRGRISFRAGWPSLEGAAARRVDGPRRLRIAAIEATATSSRSRRKFLSRSRSALP